MKTIVILMLCWCCVGCNTQQLDTNSNLGKSLFSLDNPIEIQDLSSLMIPNEDKVTAFEHSTEIPSQVEEISEPTSPIEEVWSPPYQIKTPSELNRELGYSWKPTSQMEEIVIKSSEDIAFIEDEDLVKFKVTVDEGFDIIWENLAQVTELMQVFYFGVSIINDRLCYDYSQYDAYHTARVNSYYVDVETGKVYSFQLNHDRYNSMWLLNS